MSGSAFVISINDCVEAVVLGTKEAAEDEMERLARVYFDTHQTTVSNDYKTFRAANRWWIRQVPAIQRS